MTIRDQVRIGRRNGIFALPLRQHVSSAPPAGRYASLGCACPCPAPRRALLGPNGAGKTTLFHLISGELPPTAGRILLFGRDVTHLPPHRRAALGMARTYQITNLCPQLTVLHYGRVIADGLADEVKADPLVQQIYLGGA